MGREKETHHARGPAQLTQLSPLTTLAGGAPYPQPSLQRRAEALWQFAGAPDEAAGGRQGPSGTEAVVEAVCTGSPEGLIALLV